MCYLPLSTLCCWADSGALQVKGERQRFVTLETPRPLRTGKGQRPLERNGANYCTVQLSTTWFRAVRAFYRFL